MSNAAKQFMIGLPGAGKTTFLAALWHVLASGEVPESLQLSHLHGNHSYLNRIRDEWVSGKELDRTPIEDEQSVSIILKSERSTTEFVISDLSGESFELQWTDRIMPQQFADLLTVSNGGLLLVHPAVRSETLIREANAIIEQISDTPPSSRQSDSVPWEAKNAPTQVQLVELLQFVRLKSEHRPIRLAVIVSAWDLINEKTPGDWIKDYLPLVHQFLESNPETFLFKYFGLSGQGGNLGHDAERLLEYTLPSHRIRMLSDNGTESNDITMPIRWTMGWE